MGADSTVRFLNHLRFNLARLLRAGSMTEEMLDQIIELVKDEARDTTDIAALPAVREGGET